MNCPNCDGLMEPLKYNLLRCPKDGRVVRDELYDMPRQRIDRTTAKRK